MVEAYYYREQKAWLPFRRLSAIVLNAIRGEDDKPVKEHEIQWLTMIDEPPAPPKKSEPVVWTDEQLKEFQKKFGYLKE